MRLVPTTRAAALLALGLVPAIAASFRPELGWVALGLDLLVVGAVLLDGWRAPGAGLLTVTREVQEVISAGVPGPVLLRIESRSERQLWIEVADDPPLEATVPTRRFALRLLPLAVAERRYLLTPLRRGDHSFGDLHVRVLGPWGLCARQWSVPAARAVKAYPDLAALSRDALALSRPDQETALARARRALGEGREFESLRPYVRGDDYRAIDWKASARRGTLIARAFEPERNQTLLLLLDAGRHMTARVAGRGRLDHAIDAALRLSRVGLDRGDQVGLLVAGATLVASVPPGKGRAQLHRIVDALYRIPATLDETDWGMAFDELQARVKRRALVVAFTDLTDEEASRQLLSRIARLRPRHLPLVVACEDSELSAAARAVPVAPEEAYRRAAAGRLVRDREATRRRLVAVGAHVVSVPAGGLSAAAINEYLDIKGRGLL